MAQRRNALGRGLGALLPSPGAKTSGGAPADAPAPIAARERASLAVPAAPEVLGAPTEIPIGAIVPNPDQPRRLFDEEDLDALARSIKRHGILQPVLVRRASDGSEDRYELIVGERRWRASKRAGLETMPVTIADLASDELLEVALVENVQRKDLNPMELALAFRALNDAGYTQEQIGTRVGLDRSSVANHLRLLELPKELQQDVENGAITMGHAKALLSLGNPERRRALRDRIVTEGLSVRAAEDAARDFSGGSAKKAPRRPRGSAVDPNLRDLVASLEAQLQTRVRITGAASRGKIELDFHGPEELHRLTLAILEGPGSR